MKSTKGFCGSFLAFVATLMFTCTFLAVEPSQVDAQRRRGGQPRVIQLDEIVIEGRVQKPNAFYLLARANLGYEVLDLRTSFLRDVIRSVHGEPF